METIKTKLASRKWWAAFCGAIAPVALAYLGEDIQLWEAIQASAAIVISYLFAQGAVDYAAAKQIT